MRGLASNETLTAADFGRALLNPEADTPAGVTGPDGQAAPKRFNVYRNNVIVSLCDALAQSFPAIGALLGEEYFRALARAFVLEHPPETPVLLWYGGGFADFIETFPPLKAYPYLADVARLEWAWLQAYHAADAAPLDPAALAAIAPEAVGDIRFEMHPAARIVPSNWAIWDLVRLNRFEPEPDEGLNPDCPQPVLVSRPDLEVNVLLLGPGGDIFLEALMRGASLGEAAGLALEACKEFNLSDCLSDCLSNGAFSGLRCDR
ncbi:HvfC/BufC N-terminal domain-containing protein [Roseibium sp. M-1]